MRLAGITRFLASPAEREAIAREFQLAASGLVLGPACRSRLEDLTSASGCYLWTMDVDEDRFKIYIGQTRSLRKRVTDYSIEMQIHSPNDFKLRFFQELALEVFPSARFDVHFAPLPDGERHEREKSLVRQFAPLINTLRVPTQADRAIILNGYRQYYRAAFAHRCGDA